MSTRTFRIRLGLIAVAALVGRVIYVWLVTSRQSLLALPGAGATAKVSLGRTVDEYQYRSLAISLARGKGLTAPVFGGDALPNADHPPLTSIVVAPVARFLPDSDIALRLPVALAGALIVVFVGLVAAHLAGSRAGLLAAGLAAVYPNLWVHDGLLLSETFSALTTIVIVYCAYRFVRDPTYVWAGAFGAACAVGSLARAELLLLLVLLLPWAIFKIPKEDRVRLGATALCATAIVLLPLVAYNFSRFDRPVLVSYGDGGVLAGANCDPVYHGDKIGYWNGLCALVDQPREPSVDAATLRTRGLEYMRGHVSRLPVVMTARVGRIWGVFKPVEMLREWQLEGKPLWASTIGYVMYIPLVGLSVYGVVVLRRRRVPVFPLIAPLILVTAIAAAFYGLLRNRVPAEVCFVVLGAIAIDALWDSRSGAARSAAGAGGAQGADEPDPDAERSTA